MATSTREFRVVIGFLAWSTGLFLTIRPLHRHIQAHPYWERRVRSANTASLNVLPSMANPAVLFGIRQCSPPEGSH